MRSLLLFGFLLLYPSGNALAEGSWQEQDSGVNPRVNGVFFADPSNGWAVGMPPIGGNARILHTTDGGMTWSTQSSGTPHELQALDFLDQNEGWTVGKMGTILHTSDGGSTWENQSLVFPVGLKGVSSVDSVNGWTVGQNGFILHTSNGGTNWNIQVSGTFQELNGVIFLNQDEGWAVGNGGEIRHTTNGGSNWGGQTSGVTDNLNGVSFLDTEKGWVVGDGGRILQTTDGGATWDTLDSGVTEDLNSVSFTDVNNGWVVGTNGVILQTTDGGTTWTSDTGVTTVNLNGVQFLDGSYGPGWAVGAQGKIFRYDENTPLEFALIQRSSSVTITWKSIDGAFYDILIADSLLGTFADTADVEATDTLSSWTDSDDVSERYYQVHSRSGLYRTSNTTGQFKLTVVAESPPGDKMQLISLPSVQFSNPIDSVLGAQLIGEDSELNADRIWKWDPDSTKFRYVWLVDNVGPCCDGRWFETIDGIPVPTDLTLDADEGFWIQNRHGVQEIILVGEVSDVSNRTINFDYGIQEFGSAYPVVVELDSSDLYQDGATGSINELDADRIWYWDTDTDSWDFS
ncbi:hypothetical protein IIA15_05700, partial [candidate division TA06 bacterium]|nr:hypothetical protein [candidate division TA06 bacterium]